MSDFFELDIEVRPYKVRARCSKCYEGDLLPTGMVLTVNPPKYPHKCTNCDNQVNMQRMYPYMKYEELGNGR